MPLVKLSAAHTRDLVTYASGTIIEVDTDTRDLLVGATLAVSVTNGGTWAAGSYASGVFVYHTGTSAYWLANTACIAGDVPGVSPNWTSVLYAQPYVNRERWSKQGGEIYGLDAFGNYRRMIPQTVGDNNIVPAFEDP